MNTETKTLQLRAGIVALAPAVLLAAFLYHPYIGWGPPDDARIAAALIADTTRWGLAHLSIGVASALMVLAFLAIRAYLRDAGEEHWSARAVPAIVISGTLYAMLPGMELAATLSAAETGASVEAAQSALRQWFLPVIMASGFTFAVGAFGFARGIAESRVLRPPVTYLVVAALLVMAAARLAPLAGAQNYVQSVAAVVALWPVAFQMWKGPRTEDARRRQPMPAL